MGTGMGQGHGGVADRKKESLLFGYGSIEICYAIVDFEEIIEGEREGAGHGPIRNC